LPCTESTVGVAPKESRAWHPQEKHLLPPELTKYEWVFQPAPFLDSRPSIHASCLKSTKNEAFYRTITKFKKIFHKLLAIPTKLLIISFVDFKPNRNKLRFDLWESSPKRCYPASPASPLEGFASPNEL
jgi:hypothetical protein